MTAPTKRTRATPAPKVERADPVLAARTKQDVGRQIGRVVRQLRDSQGLTLAEAAATADISPAMLSRIETGRVTPSLETLVSLSGALGVRPATLLQDLGDESDGAQHVPAGRGLEVIRRGTRRGHTYHLLAAQRGPRKTVEPFLVTLTDKSEVFPGFQHAGTEFIYILSGVIRYRHGTESYLLQPGDSLTFRGDIPHGPETLEKVPIRMLSIIVYEYPDTPVAR
ncbi:MAG TPA: XRE family transcriptional regulator [Steroidobacteraceae bacterium]|jgi:transcriptional regulator with XRE-family HTH domain|nr:XRE family transcriptional regulator [Steroidobacteraceae bacterium]